MKFQHALALLPALLLGACSYELGVEKQRALPDQIVLQGTEHFKLPSEYPTSNQSVNLATSVAKKVWELPLGTNPILDAHYQNGYVLLTTTTNLLYLIDASTGVIKWAVNVPIPANFPVGISKDRIYYSAGDTIVESDLFSGKIINTQRHLQHVSIPTNGLGFYGDLLFITTSEGDIQAHQLIKNNVRNWIKKVPEWAARLPHEPTGALVVIPPQLYYSDAGGSVTRISALAGERYKLSFKRVGFKPLHPPVLQDTTLYQIFDDNTLYAINRHSMLVDWSYPMGFPEAVCPLLGTKSIVVSLGTSVDVLNLKGVKQYSSNLIVKPLYFDNENLIGLSASHEIVALDAQGKVLWKQNTLLKDEDGDTFETQRSFKQGAPNAFISISADRQNIAFYATGVLKKPSDYKVAKKIKIKDLPEEKK